MAYVIKIKFEDSLRRLTVRNNGYGEILSFGDLSRRIRDLFQMPEAAEFVVTYTDSDGDVVTMANDHDLTDAMVQQSLNPLRLHVTLKNPESATEEKVEDAEMVDAVDREGVSAKWRNVMKRLSTYPDMDYMKQLIQSYEPFFENVKTPAQMKALVENVVQGMIAHTSSKPSASANPVGSLPNVTAPSPPKVSSASETSRQVDQAPAPPAGNFGGTQEIVAPPVHHGVVCDVCGMSPIVGHRWKALKKYNYDLCNTCFERNGNADEYTKLDRPMFRPRHLLNHKMMRSCSVHPHDRGMRMHGAHPMCAESLDRQAWSDSLHGRGRQSFGGIRGSGARNFPTMRGWGGKLDARFVRDVTVFDGTEVAPGRRFTKIWRLRNSGDVAWPANTKLVHIGGDELGQMAAVPLEIPEQGLAPDAEMDASVDLVAPQKPGRYVSHWRLASPQGPKFGHRVWVLIQVLPSEVFEQAEAEYQALSTAGAEDLNGYVQKKREEGESSTLLGKIEHEKAQLNNVPDMEWNLRPEERSRNVQTSSGLPLDQNAEYARTNPQHAEVLTKDLDSAGKSGVGVENHVARQGRQISFEDLEKILGNEGILDSESTVKEDVGRKNVVDGLSAADDLPAERQMDYRSEITGEKEEADEEQRRGTDKDDGYEAYFYNASESDPFSFLTEKSMNVAEGNVGAGAGYPRIYDGSEYPTLDELLGKSGKFSLEDEKSEEKTSLKNFLADMEQMDNSTVEAPVGAPAVEAPVEVPSVEALGEGSVVEASVENPAIEARVEDPAVEARVEDPVVEVIGEDLSVKASVENSTAEVSAENTTAEASVEAGEREEEISSPEALLAKLQVMGFTDSKLNLEILTKNSFDIRKTLDDLCTAEEWDPILEELEEMGFYDTDMNRRLMFKNNGSVKRVVKDLVKMDKTVSAGGKGKQIAE